MLNYFELWPLPNLRKLCCSLRINNRIAGLRLLPNPAYKKPNIITHCIVGWAKCNVPTVRFDSGTTIWNVLLGNVQRPQRIDKITKQFDTQPTKFDLYFVIFSENSPRIYSGVKEVL